MNRRNLEALEESLHQAKSSKLSNKLQTLIHKAEAEVADLKKLDKHAHDILDMNLVTVTELRNYKTPKPIVHDVMKATFLLLGEREDYLEVKVIVKFCLFVWTLSPHSRIFHSYGDPTIAGEGLQILTYSRLS